MQVLMDNQTQYKERWFDYMGYKPHLGQRKLHFPDKETAQFFVMVCGRRFGKTFLAINELAKFGN